MIELEDFEKVDMRVAGSSASRTSPRRVLVLEPGSGSQPGDRIA